MDIVGGNIRKLRKARGLLQKELADLAKMDPSNLSKLERGDYTWTKENLERIAKALGVSLAELFESSDSANVRAALHEEPGNDQHGMLVKIDARLDELTRIVIDGFSRSTTPQIDKGHMPHSQNERTAPPKRSRATN